MRERFFEAVVNAASIFDSIGHQYQEDCKADEVLDRSIESVKNIHNKVSKNLQISEELLKLYTELSNEQRVISDRIKAKRIRETRTDESKKLETDIADLLFYIQERLTINNEEKKQEIKTIDKSSNDKKRKPTEIRKSLNSLKTSSQFKEDVKYESLLSLIDDLEIKYDDNLKLLFEIIDEKFVQARASCRDDYYKLLTELKNEFINEED